MRVVFSRAARADLRAIGDWIARDAPRRALSFVEELRATCRVLGVHPKSVPVARIISGRRLRRAVHGPYLIYVEVDDRQNMVIVVRIVHGARDQEAIFARRGGQETQE